MDDAAGFSSMENGVCDRNATADETQEEILQMVMELGFQNDYLKAQIGSVGSQLLGLVGGNAESGDDSEKVSQLHEKIRCLNKEIQEQKETQSAAEDALEHLRVAHADADAKVQELSAKLAEAQQKMEQEIKERDDKYVELDSKFTRLHKRAKQRIQELQKEKDDLEAHVLEINAMAEQASKKQTLAQQELERARQLASEALQSMDAEKQQLRTTNNKLRDNIDEMRRSLEAKENALTGLQQTLFEKEKMLEDTRNLLRALEEKKQTSFMEISAKHQKQVESLEAQLADMLLDRNKIAETVSSLQMLVDEKDKKIAELDAASSGEVVRLGVALEEVKGELVQLQDKHEKERESWEAARQTFRAKLEASESACLRSEIEAAKTKSQLEQELSILSQSLNAKDTELVILKDEIKRLESEFSAYKVRAHALLQKKDAELNSAKNSEQMKALEEAIREAEKDLVLVSAERDKAIQDLQDALANHVKEIAARDAALNDAQQQIKGMARKLDTADARYLSEKESWLKNLESIEENWKLRCSALEAQKMESIGVDTGKAFEELTQQYEKLKEEHDAFRDIADRMIEEKEKEVAKLLDDNRSLRHSLDMRPIVDQIDNKNTASQKQDSQIFSVVAAEQQILLLARQQAQREEELAQSQRHILALQEEIEELERENRLHSQQEAMLKAELRDVERSQKREGVDMTYLKNVVLKLLETGEVEALLPVIGKLLQFSPEEIKKCQQAYSTSGEAPNPATQTGAASTPRSIFSSFGF